MKTLEDYVDIKELQRKGFSQRQIAKKLGIHRKTVKKVLAKTEITQVQSVYTRSSKLDEYKEFIKTMLENDFEYKATNLYDKLLKVGFTGSYEIVKRYVSAFKKEKVKKAFIRFETEPGFQAQVDFGEFQIATASGKVIKLYLFLMILGYSRKLYAAFLPHCDLARFLDCHQRAFQFFGGVPQEILYDRMKNVYIGRYAGKDRFNNSLLSMAFHFGFRPRVAPAYAPWVKGKVERPFSFIREGFWRGYKYTHIERAQSDLDEWLQMKDERIHGTTHERVSVRFEKEKPFLGLVPANDFDSSYRLFRTVAKDCTIRFDGNSFVVPHHLVEKQVLVRVKAPTLRVYDNESLVVSYTIPEGKGNLVQNTRFYAALQADREQGRMKFQGPSKKQKGRAVMTYSPSLPAYADPVEARSIQDYEQFCGVSQ